MKTAKTLILFDFLKMMYNIKHYVQVMMSFEYNDPNRPFVLGSLFTGKTGAGGGSNNVKKSIVTRGGHVIELNDKSGSEMITITDKNGNIFSIDTAKNNIQITALDKMSFTAKEIEINAHDNLNINVGKDKTERIQGDRKLYASNIYEIASKDMKSEGETISRQSKKDMNIISTEGNINKQAEKKINNSSGEKGNIF